jgi:peptidoglycan/xylan/chitin deacetylase (PgdA/CDA1 family)
MDSAEVIFVKRMLQHGLREDLRGELARDLFDRFVGVDSATFAAELYMTPEQLRTMIRSGMYVGSHGARHYWFDRLDPVSQTKEIDESLDFLRALGAPTNDWVMCYPYGSYNDTLLPLLRERGCSIGLTTKVGVAQLGTDDPLVLPRMDTNDLPHN